MLKLLHSEDAAHTHTNSLKMVFVMKHIMKFFLISKCLFIYYISTTTYLRTSSYINFMYQGLKEFCFFILKVYMLGTECCTQYSAPAEDYK